MSAKSEMYLKQLVLDNMDLKAQQTKMLEVIVAMDRRMRRMECQSATNEKVDPNKEYKTRDLMRILKMGKNQVLALLNSGEILAEKQGGAGGYKIMGYDLLAYIEKVRARKLAALPHAARG